MPIKTILHYRHAKVYQQMLSKMKKLISTVFFFFILSAGQKTVLTGSVNYTICFGNVYKLKNIDIWGLLVLPFMENSTSTIW